MIRFLAIVILLGGLGGGIYYLFSMEVEQDLKVTGKLQISEQITHNVSLSKDSHQKYFATVMGKVKNNLKKPLKNIFIKYEIDGQKVSATIFDLAPGQQVSFNTSGINTDVPNPEYDYKGFCFD
jgi:hypothetical protein